jgi:membrane-associated protease RseP (regulator of RpoE activity)
MLVSVAFAGLIGTVAWAGQNPCGNVTVIRQAAVAGDASPVSGGGSGACGDTFADALRQAEEAIAQLGSEAGTGAIARQVGELLRSSIGPMAVSASTQTASPGPRPWLGVSTEEIGDDVRSLLPDTVTGGLMVRHVDAESPAAKAGIQVNDILLKLDDQILVNPAQLRSLIHLRKEGDAVALAGLRKGKELEYKPALVMKDDEDAGGAGDVVIFGQPWSDVKMELPPEIKKLIESGGSGATVFSTSIVIRSGSSSSASAGRGSSAGISARTENGSTTITYNGEQVFSGPTSGRISTQCISENGSDYAAAFDGDKVLWENKPGSAARLKK